MVRKRPRQHWRVVKTKDGHKTILVNKGIKGEEKIAIPPAWKNVKVYNDKDYVATGVDNKGRLQYIYPTTFKLKQSKKKYTRVRKLKKKIPTLLNKLYRDMNKDVQESEVLYTIYKTGFRPGSDKDTKAEKQAFGVTTLLKNHVKLDKKNKEVDFNFVGKKGVKIAKSVKDKKLYDIIQKRLKSKKLFETNSERVRRYLKEKAGKDFTVKDLRTLKAYDVATKHANKKGATKKRVKEAVASELVNTPSIAGQSYIDPKIIGGMK